MALLWQFLLCGPTLSVPDPLTLGLATVPSLGTTLSTPSLTFYTPDVFIDTIACFVLIYKLRKEDDWFYVFLVFCGLRAEYSCSGWLVDDCPDSSLMTDDASLTSLR